MRMRRADGSLFWAHLTGKLVNPEDTAEGSIWVVDDITEQKQPSRVAIPTGRTES